MTRSRVRAEVALAKVEIVREMLHGITTLPLESQEGFLADPRMVAAGESYLRRGLEALLDLGRHILAKGFAVAATEYKAIPHHLGRTGVLDAEHAALFVPLAGYRNRMVHFYDEITQEELYDLLTRDLGDLRRILEALVGWLRDHPERVDDDV